MPKPTTDRALNSTAGLFVVVIKQLLIPAVVLLSATTTSATRPSYYPNRLRDSQAVYLDSAEFSVHGDGQGDDTDALQSAINKVQHDRNQGIVFVPTGRYRLSRTIYV